MTADREQQASKAGVGKVVSCNSGAINVLQEGAELPSPPKVGGIPFSAAAWLQKSLSYSGSRR